MQLIPYVNLLAIFILMPIFAGLVQSSVNDLIKTSATTSPRGTLQSLPAGPGMPVWGIVLVVFGCSIFPIAILAALLLPALAKAQQKAVRINCASNLKSVGFAFRIWEGDNGDLYPFNVSTNKGGTFEISSKGPNGFDINSWRHFQVMSNELNNPRILICPADTGKQAAIDFAHLQSINVTYAVHPGTNVSDVNPRSVLAICPIHHNVLFADASVQQLNEVQMRKLMESVALEK